MSKANENKDISSLHNSNGIEKKGVKCKLSYGGSGGLREKYFQKAA